MADGEHDRDVHDGTGLGENEHDDSDEDRGGVPRGEEEVTHWTLDIGYWKMAKGECLTI